LQIHGGPRTTHGRKLNSSRSKASSREPVNNRTSDEQSSSLLQPGFPRRRLGPSASRNTRVQFDSCTSAEALRTGARNLRTCEPALHRFKRPGQNVEFPQPTTGREKPRYEASVAIGRTLTALRTGQDRNRVCTRVSSTSSRMAAVCRRQHDDGRARQDCGSPRDDVQVSYHPVHGVGGLGFFSCRNHTIRMVV